jgi:hypothetical protein
MVALQGRARDVFKTPTQEGRMRHRHVHVTLAAMTVLVTLALVTPAFAAPEAPETVSPANNITGTSAELTGVLNPHSTAKAGWFFAYNQGLSCSGGPTTPQEPEVEGEALPEHAEATGLEPSKEYTFCLVATNEAAESTTGLPEVSFKTAALPPAVDSESSSSITPFQARIEGLVNPNNQTTSCVMEYGETTGYGEKVNCEPESLEGFGDQGVGFTATGLNPGTTYHFRVVVENAANEKTEGADSEFTTLPLEKPIVGSESVSALTSTGATLNATVNPNYQETTYAFEYATNEALTGAVTVNGESSLPAEFAELPVSVNTEALQPRTTYFYRVVATNSPGGTDDGPVQSFTTPGTPIATTSAAQSITRTTAALSGTVNPGGEPATFHFAYATAANYQPGAPNPYVKGATTPESASVGSGFTAHPAGPSAIGELQPGTTYHYALVATNPVGTVIGPDVEFTTSPATPPLASTGGSEGVSWNGATITGSVDTRGLATTIEFELGTTPGSGEFTAAEPSFAASGTLSASAHVGPYLEPDTTYYYRTVATNVDGTGYGEERSFTTGTFPGQAGPAAVSLVAWPGFMLKELASGIPPTPAVTGPKPLTKKQKLAKALKACSKKHGKKRAACRRAAKRRFR